MSQIAQRYLRYYITGIGFTRAARDERENLQCGAPQQPRGSIWIAGLIETVRSPTAVHPARSGGGDHHRHPRRGPPEWDSKSTRKLLFDFVMELRSQTVLLGVLHPTP